MKELLPQAGQAGVAEGPLAAAASLLPPLHVILFYAVAKLLALVLGPVLMRGRPVWPFMPVVSMATLAILALGWLS